MPSPEVPAGVDLPISERQQSFEHHRLQSIQWGRIRFIVLLAGFPENCSGRCIGTNERQLIRDVDAPCSIRQCY
jgi:hypothetical protein